MFRSGNPALRNDTFTSARPIGDTSVMTIQGTVNKTGFLLLLMIISAGFTWKLFVDSGPAAVMPLMGLGAIGGLIVAMILIFTGSAAFILAPLYALLEGLFIGGISSILEARFPGIVIQAVGLTLGTLGCLLLAYKSGLIRPTENFKLGVAAATGGVFMIYMVSFVLGFFGMGVPYIHESGLIGIGFSLAVVVIASLNLVLDFDFIERGSKGGLPKYMEWVAALGLMVTLVWLYLEILRSAENTTSPQAAPGTALMPSPNFLDSSSDRATSEEMTG